MRQNSKYEAHFLGNENNVHSFPRLLDLLSRCAGREAFDSVEPLHGSYLQAFDQFFHYCLSLGRFELQKAILAPNSNEICKSEAFPHFLGKIFLLL